MADGLMADGGWQAQSAESRLRLVRAKKLLLQVEGENNAKQKFTFTRFGS